MITFNRNWLMDKFEKGDSIEYIYFFGHSENGIGKFCFSQWFESPFCLDNITFQTAEHWMMAKKALLFNDYISFEKICQSKTPENAKKLGKEVKGFNQEIWDSNKVDIVKLGNIHKFNQYPELAKFLINTADKVIVEASPSDLIWGIGLVQNDENIENIYLWRGENLLGFILMEVREFFNKIGHFSPLENLILPPWNKFPNVEMNDLFWKMGLGEEYLYKFSKYYLNLSDKDKIVYKLYYPSSLKWSGFYD